MYSRYDHRRDSTVRLPENYSGTAFLGNAISPATHEPTAQRIEIGKPSSRETAPRERLPITDPPQKTTWEAPKQKPPVKESGIEERIHPPSANAPSAPSHHPPMTPPTLGGLLDHAFPLAHGLGFEELLLIGLIILLAHGEQSSNVTTWLALLLFCG